MTAQEQKTELRRRAREILKSIPSEIRAASGEKLRDIICAQSIWENARAVLLYAPLPNEPDARALFRAAKSQGKLIALPRFNPATGTYVAAEADEASLVVGAFGALEPPSGALIIKSLDFILTPGLAFDSQGRRLGRGKGFYDRLLSEAPAGCVKCGVAFDEQILPHIPAESHDVSVDFIATPSQWLDCRGQTPAR